MKTLLKYIKAKNKEIGGVFLFLSLFLAVILLFVLFNVYVKVPDNFFSIFLIFALLLFIIDPFLKANLPSFKANLLLVEIYIFFVHFTIVLSGATVQENIFFFLYLIPIISAAMSFGIRGSIGTTIVIFILYNLSKHKTYNPIDILTFISRDQTHEIPKFISLFIMALMVGFLSEQNQLLVKRAYQRVSRIVTLKEIRHGLKFDFKFEELVDIVTNAVVKLAEADYGLGYIYKPEVNSILQVTEKGIELKMIRKDYVAPVMEPELFRKSKKIINKPYYRKLDNIIKISFKVNEENTLVIFLSRKDIKFTDSDLEVAKTLKIYIELLLRNYDLYKKVESVNDYLYHSFKNIPTSIIILDKNLKILFVNNQALLSLKYDNFKDLVGKAIDRDIYIFDDTAVMEAIKNQQSIFHKNTIISNKKHEKKKIECTTTLLKTDFGISKGTIISYIDITEIKDMEEELHRRERLASLGQMAAGLAHELRNPLGGIEGFASLLKKELQDNPRAHKLADKIVQGTEELNKIVKQFLDFTSRMKLDAKQQNIHDVLDKTLLYVRNDIEKYNINLVKKYCSKKTMVKIDADKIRQVLLNLLLNAIDAVKNEEKGVITLSTRIIPQIAAQNSAAFEISIIDNGVGIDKDKKSEIFNPFYTTKQNGVGLGLTISQRIIEEHSGSIFIQSNENETKFSIRLPFDERFAYIS